MHKSRGRRWRSDRVSHEHHDAPDVGPVAGVDGALGAAPVERAQDPAPVALDEEADEGLTAAPGVANRNQAAVGRGLVGIDPDVVAPDSASRATRTCPSPATCFGAVLRATL